MTPSLNMITNTRKEEIKSSWKRGWEIETAQTGKSWTLTEANLKLGGGRYPKRTSQNASIEE